MKRKSRNCMESSTLSRMGTIILLSLVLIFPFASHSLAEKSNYGVNLENSAYTRKENPVAKIGYYGECTWYCWGRAKEKLGVALSWGDGIHLGNANDWDAGASSAGYSVGKEPRANSIMVEHYSGTGHVLFVEEIKDGFAYVTEANYLGRNYFEDVIDLAKKERKSWPGHVMGDITYIYLEKAVHGSEMPSGYERILQDGNYLIACAADTSFLLDIDGTDSSAAKGANVAIWKLENDQPNECDIWTIAYHDGFYTIRQKGTNMCLDVHEDNGSMLEPNANVQVWDSTSAPNQQWAISQNGDAYRIQARCSGFSLDYMGAVLENGSNVTQYPNNDSDAQKWTFFRYDTTHFAGGGGGGGGGGGWGDEDSDASIGTTQNIILEQTGEQTDQIEPEEYTSGDYTYRLFENGEAQIVRYNGHDSTVTVPPTLDGHPVTAIGDNAFFYHSGKYGINSITLPDSITSIGNYAFSDCYINSITLPSNLKTLGEGAFSNCWPLTSVTLPDSIEKIGENPFYACFSLQDIRVSSNHPTLATIDGVLFYKPEKRLVCYPVTKENNSYTVPQGIRIIGDEAFFEANLQSITLPDSLISIGKYAFYQSRLIYVDLPNNLNVIGERAFSSCQSLTSITLPNGLKMIGDEAFFFCNSLTTIILPDSITEIGINPFGQCSSLQGIRVSSSHPTLATIDGVLFNKPEKRLICYPLAKENSTYTVPEGIRVIGDKAFSCSKRLTSVTLPDSLTTIGEEAFSICENLISVTLSDSVTAIGDKAFSNCPNLTLTISRGSYAVQYCKDNNVNYSYPDAYDWLDN